MGVLRQCRFRPDRWKGGTSATGCPASSLGRRRPFSVARLRRSRIVLSRRRDVPSHEVDCGIVVTARDQLGKAHMVFERGGPVARNLQVGLICPSRH